MSGCPYCQKPVKDAAVLCIWCLRLIKDYAADREIQHLLSIGATAAAIELVRTKAGISDRQARQVVERLTVTAAAAAAPATAPGAAAPLATAIPGNPSAAPTVTLARGANGEVELSADRVRIRRRGAISFVTHGLQGEKEIYLRRITSIQFKPAGAFTKGYIQFAYEGGHEAKRGIIEAAGDENTVLFTVAQQHEFVAFKAAVEGRMESLRIESGRPQSPSASDSIEGLNRLVELHTSGLLTDEEFGAAKRKLLGI